MKSLLALFFTLFILFFASCSNENQNQSQNKYSKNALEVKDTKKYFIDPSSNRIIGRIYVLDECEYIFFSYNGNSLIITHHGNCPNPIHKINTQIVFDKNDHIQQELIETRRVADDLASILAAIVQDTPIEYLKGYVDEGSLRPYQQLVMKYRKGS